MLMSKRFRRSGAFLATVSLLALFALPVMAKGNKPIVAIIKAEWCSACQKLDPIIMELKQHYGDRLEFVVLDVTNDDSVAEARKTAQKHGLAQFLQQNQKKTSTVAVFGSDKKILFQTAKNFDREAYVKAFEEAIARM